MFLLIVCVLTLRTRYLFQGQDSAYHLTSSFYNVHQIRTPNVYTWLQYGQLWVMEQPPVIEKKTRFVFDLSTQKYPYCKTSHLLIALDLVLPESDFFRISFDLNRLLESLVVECWLRVREVPGSIPSQGPRHTKDVIKMVPVVPLFSTEHWKGKILALSQE